MWQRLNLYDLRVIGHYLGVLVLLCSAMMAVPFVLALVLGEWEPASRYLFCASIALVAGNLLRFLQIEPSRLNKQQALVVTGLAWIVMALFCAIPLYFSGHYISYLDSLYESVSGLTTTGASIIVDLDHLSNADNMFRFTMHLVGGLGFIVIALSLGMFRGHSSAALYISEAHSEHVVPNVVQTARFIVRVSAAVIACVTLVTIIICLFAGLDPLRAILHGLWISISGYTTGGFTPTSQSILYYHSLPLELFMILVMFLGSISFVLISEIWHGRTLVFFRDIETRTAVLWISMITAVFTIAMCSGSMFTELPALLRRGFFMLVSAFSTTGFQVVTTNQLLTVFSSGAFVILMLIMTMGGDAGSTAGGIKLFRLGIIFKSFVSTVKEVLSPSSARVVVSYNHVGRRILTPEVVREAMTVFVLFIVSYIVGTMVGVAYGNDATMALSESISMTSNVGLIVGIASPGMEFSLEIVYIIQMWVGRLEFITILAMVVKIFVSAWPHGKVAKR